jgi:hypothetical protein
MTWDNWRRHWHSSAPGAVSSRARRIVSPLAVEPLEGRLLLSLYQGPTRSRPVFSNGAVYQVTLTGPGFETVTPLGRGFRQQFAINLFGTTTASTLSVSLMRTRRGFNNAHSTLQIGRINVASGQLGGVQALGAADLVGSITPLNGSISTLQFNTIGPKATIDVKGGLGSLSAGGVTIGPTGHIDIGSLGGPDSLGGLTLDGGQFTIDGDLTGPFNVGSVMIERGGQFKVGGNLSNLTVGGIFQGQGTSAIDLKVGLNLINFTVLSGSSNLGSVRGANIDVGKDIAGLDIRHGIFNSLITAGVLIDGSPQNSSSGGNIGPDGANAIFDSQLLAGVQIKNLLINGDVTSDYVTNPKPNPTGYPTRIVAGEVLEDRAPGKHPQGNFTSAGNIDNFQITGSLIDAVLAASVAPYGGDGTFPPPAYAPPRSVANTPGDQGFNTYDAPAGFIVGGTLAAPIAFPNFSEASYFNETFFSRNGNFPEGDYLNTSIDPTIDDAILPGEINPSFATAPADLNAASGPAAVIMTTTKKLSLPTKSTVPGGVISHQHVGNPDANDFAGIFADDTRGVFVGTLPLL